MMMSSDFYTRKAFTDRAADIEPDCKPSPTFSSPKLPLLRYMSACYSRIMEY